MSAVDLAHGIETPEGSTLTLRPAGPCVRGTAWAFDTLIRFVFYAVVGTVAGFLGQMGMGLVLLVLFAGEWLYFALFEAFRSGATPGKRRMGLRVVQVDGGPVSLEAALVRNLVRFVDALPFFYGAGLVCCLFSGRFQRLGDHFAGTLVVHAEEDSPTSSLGRSRRRLRALRRRRSRGKAPSKAKPAQAKPGLEPLRPPHPLTGQEAALVQSFAERRTRLHPKRQEELADLLHALTGARGEAGVQVLRQQAAWLERER